MPVEIKDKVKDWILCHWGNIVFVMFEKVHCDVSPRPGGKMFTIVCNNVVSSSTTSRSRSSIQAFYRTQSPPHHLFFLLQMTMEMFCQLQLTTILPTCLLWKGGSWMSRELLILARLEAQTDPRGSMSTLEKDTLTCFWEPSKTFEGSMNTQRSEKAARKGLRIYIHLPPSPLSPLPKLALLSSMEPSPVGFALQ